MKVIVAVLAVLLLVTATTAVAADVSPFDVSLTRIATASPGERNAAIDLLFNQVQTMVIALQPQLTPTREKIVRQYRALRSDTQTGASSGSSGSTSMVLNPYLADIFGISFESGSIIKTVSGSTINLQIRPAGIFCAVRDQDGSRAAPGTDCVDFWKRVGISASFDKNRSNAPSQLVALQDDFSQLRVHFDLLQPLVSDAARALDDRMSDLSARGGEVFDQLRNNAVFTQWRTEARAMVVASLEATDSERRNALNAAWSDALDKLQSLLQNNASLHTLSPTLREFSQAAIDANLRAIVLEQLERTSFAIEVAWDRPDVAKANQANGIITKGQRPPDLLTARLIYTRNYQPLILTANAEAAWFKEVLPGMRGNFRNWQISAAATFLLKEIPNFGRTTLSFSGLIGDLHQQPLGFDYVVPVPGDPTQTQKVNLAGSIRAFNARLEFPTANKSVTIPISFTYANRTDLQREADVKGSVGLTLRFDSFFPTKP